VAVTELRKAPADHEIAGVLFFTAHRHFQEAGMVEETFRR
jgi:hypothetical protein